MENREPEKSNPNHRKVFYFLNILFMCMITAASLAMTVILFVRLERLRSEKQVEGSIYTGPLKSACVPGLNCYSCPGAVAACPLGLRSSLLSSQATARSQC